MTDDPEAAVRAFYRALDEHAYDRLESLLAPAFCHYRPDRTLEGRDRYVQFMREERPQKHTSHPIEAIYRNGEGELAARGRLLAADGTQITAFVDVFTTGAAGFEAVYTYTR